MAGRTIVRQRCVVLLGKREAGKSTVANHLVGHDPLSPDEPPFEVLDPTHVLVSWIEVRQKTVEFMWENDLYRVTVIETVGFFDIQIDRQDYILTYSCSTLLEIC